MKFKKDDWVEVVKPQGTRLDKGSYHKVWDVRNCNGCGQEILDLAFDTCRTHLRCNVCGEDYETGGVQWYAASR